MRGLSREAVEHDMSSMSMIEHERILTERTSMVSSIFKERLEKQAHLLSRQSEADTKKLRREYEQALNHQAKQYQMKLQQMHSEYMEVKYRLEHLEVDPAAHKRLKQRHDMLVGELADLRGSADASARALALSEQEGLDKDEELRKLREEMERLGKQVAHESQRAHKAEEELAALRGKQATTQPATPKSPRARKPKSPKSKKPTTPQPLTPQLQTHTPCYESPSPLLTPVGAPAATSSPSPVLEPVQVAVKVEVEAPSPIQVLR